MSSSGPPVLVVCNFTPVARAHYQLGVPQGGRWRECLNSDASDYGGSGQGNLGGVDADDIAAHGHPHSLRVRLPPLAVVVLMPQ
jgi:1,4-alpha-glucan branching enzyme